MPGESFAGGVSEPLRMRQDIDDGAPAPVFIYGRTTPEPGVRRVANIKNNHTIHTIVLNLLTTHILGGFFDAKTNRRYEQMKAKLILTALGSGLIYINAANATDAVGPIDCLDCRYHTLDRCSDYGPLCCPPCQIEPGEGIDCDPLTCVGTTSIEMVTGCEKVTSKGCVNNLCLAETSYRCAKGYYGAPENRCFSRSCTPCDAPGTTSGPGALQSSECYIPKDTAFNETNGSGVYAANCYYSGS